jgi:putative chitinase
MPILKLGSTGQDVAVLQGVLQVRGFNPGATDGDFGPATEAAVIAFQRSEGLLADGVVGPRTAVALGLPDPPEIPSVIPGVTADIVCQMFPSTPSQNIRKNLPVVLEALVEPKLTEKKMVLMALATIRAETESFQPISEFQSRFNTSPGGHLFDLYDNRGDLGNQGPPDGARYRGRGFIQLTGRTNYQVHGEAIGLGNQLVDNPDLANEPGIAARLLASFLKSKEQRIKEALLAGDLTNARKAVNGGSHGLDRFTDAYHIGDRLIPEEV